MTGLFLLGNHVLHSGDLSTFKIECDALTPGDWEALAHYAVVTLLAPFSEVEGVPTGGLLLAEALRQYANPEAERLLIVDDVLTTGTSMDAHRDGRDARGLVVFARSESPAWVQSVFSMV